MLKGNLVNLRAIKQLDLETLRKWRNQKESIENFFNSKRIAKKEHQNWFDQYLKNKNDMLFLIENKGLPVGVIGLTKYDKKNKSAELGRLFVNKKRQGIGYDASLTLLKFSFNKLKLNRIYLEVFPENLAAISLYKKLGFKKEGIKRESVFKNNKFRDTLPMSLLMKDYEKSSS